MCPTRTDLDFYTVSHASACGAFFDDAPSPDRSLAADIASYSVVFLVWYLVLIQKTSMRGGKGFFLDNIWI